MNFHLGKKVIIKLDCWSVQGPVRGGVQPEEVLHSEDHDTGRVQAEERYFVLVSTGQHLHGTYTQLYTFSLSNNFPRKLDKILKITISP